MFKNHPKGLIGAALSNMGERFGFYIMMAILSLFLMSKFGLDELSSAYIYSVFYALTYILALVGGLWLVWLLGYNWSVAVAIGFIALAGVAAETGVVMLIYLDQAWATHQREGARPTMRDLYEAVMEGAVERVRPKMMTVTAIMAGLLPILWTSGTGSSVMKRIAAPMVGGMVSSTVLTLIVIPAVYSLWKERTVRARARVVATEPTQARGGAVAT